MSLSKLYYRYYEPASLGGISKLEVKTKKTRKEIKDWLASQDSYTLHAPLRKKFPRKQYYVSRPNETIQLDMADMINVSKYNNGYKYILCSIDIFSRYAHCIPVKNKTGSEMVKAVKSILDSLTYPLINCQTDLGTEFYNKQVKQLFEQYKINHYSVYSEMKCALVERFIRTIKEKIYKYFTASNSYRYIDILPQPVKNYNNTKHSTIKMAPADVDENTMNTVWYTLYGEKKDPSKLHCKFHPGDYVRISKYKHKLEKGYLPKWTQEIFIVDQCMKSNPVTYKIKDWNGEQVKGIFYTSELQKVILNKDKTYIIEKVLKRKKEWVYVKWLGYPTTMNSWIPKKSLQST